MLGMMLSDMMKLGSYAEILVCIRTLIPLDVAILDPNQT
jgi:hypothetical protein